MKLPTSTPLFACCLIALIALGDARTEGAQIQQSLPAGTTVMDTGAPGTSFVGAWAESKKRKWREDSSKKVWYGDAPLWVKRLGVYTFEPGIDAGDYRIFMCWPKNRRLSKNVVVTVETGSGMSQVIVNQKRDGSQWNTIGEFALDSGAKIHVELTGKGKAAIDGIAFQPIDSSDGGDPNPDPDPDPDPPADDPPVAPTGLGTTAGRGFVSLDWDRSSESDFASFEVLRATSSNSGFGLLASELTSSSYVDNDVTNGRTYYYAVRAIDRAGQESEISSVVDATPVDDPPRAPGGLNATATRDRVALDWSNNNEDDLAGYDVYRSTQANSGFSAIARDVSSSRFGDDSVENGTRYYYFVTAIDDAGNESDSSSVVSATPVDDPPATPAALIASADESSVSLDWRDSSEDDFASYSLYRAVDGGDFDLLAGGLTASAYSDETVAPGGTYSYVVVAVDETGNLSIPSNEVEVTVGLPDRSATVSWDAPTTNEDGTTLEDLDGFTLHFGTNSGSYSDSIDVGELTEYRVDLPGPGTYFFAVTARDDTGNLSEISDEVSKSVN